MNFFSFFLPTPGKRHYNGHNDSGDAVFGIKDDVTICCLVACQCVSHIYTHTHKHTHAHPPPHAHPTYTLVLHTSHGPCSLQNGCPVLKSPLT